MAQRFRHSSTMPLLTNTARLKRSRLPDAMMPTRIRGAQSKWSINTKNESSSVRRRFLENRYGNRVFGKELI